MNVQNRIQNTKSRIIRRIKNRINNRPDGKQHQAQIDGKNVRKNKKLFV